MTLQQLEQRLNSLEREVAELRRSSATFGPLPTVSETFGMFADNPDFDEVVQLAREFRDQENAGN